MRLWDSSSAVWRGVGLSKNATDSSVDYSPIFIICDKIPKIVLAYFRNMCDNVCVE